MLLERGAVGVRVKDVAARAGLAPSSVLYYYPRIDELLMEVASQAMARYAETRTRLVRELADPSAQLRRALELGVPTGPDDEDSRLLYEIDALTGSSPAFSRMSLDFFDRQVQLYVAVLEAGAASGEFDLAGTAEEIARGLVALEDGLGLQVVLGHPGIDAATAGSILRRYAGIAVSKRLG